MNHRFKPGDRVTYAQYLWSEKERPERPRGYRKGRKGIIIGFRFQFNPVLFRVRWDDRKTDDVLHYLDLSLIEGA